MAGLFRNDPKTREGKYPVILRRDGTVPEWEWFVLSARDPASIAAVRAYADAAKALGMDPEYVADLYAMAERWRIEQNNERLWRIDHRAAVNDGTIGPLTEPPKESDPDKPAHREDDSDALNFPSSLEDYRNRLRGVLLAEAARVLASAGVPSRCLI